MRAFRLLCALVCAGAVVGCSGKGKVREPSELVDIENPAFKPDRLWRASAGTGSDGLIGGFRLALAGGALFAADADGRVFAFDAASGDRLWRTDTDAPVISGPSVSGDAVLVGTSDGAVIALARDDGRELWRRKISSEVVAPPVGDGEVVVARAVDGRVYGLSAASGDFLWAFDRSVPALVLRGMSPPLMEPGRVIVGMENGRVAALRLADGQPVWEQPVAVPAGRTELDRLTDIDAAMIETPECLFVASFGGEVACVDPVTSQVQWRRTIKTYNDLALGDGKVYVSDEAGVVWALDAASGAAAWKQEELLYRRLSPPAFVDGYVVVADLDGYVHWLDAQDGRIVARTRAGSAPVTAQPLVAGDVVYLLNVDGDITALRATE